MDKQSWTPKDEAPQRGPRLRGVVAALCLTACSPILPGEPELPVSFVLNFDSPYRVFLNGDAQEPPIKVLLGSDPVRGTVHRLESLNRSVVDVDASGQGLRGLARDTASVRVVYTTGTGTADTVFPVRVVVSSVEFRPGTAGTSCTANCTNISIRFTRLGDTARVEAVALDARKGVVPNVDATWISSGTDVATVSTTGLVTALTEGDILVTAEVDDVIGRVEVNVEQTAWAVRVAPEADTLHTIGRSARFVAAVFDSLGGLLPVAQSRWWSTDTTVAVVDPAGVVTSTGTGTTHIVARVGEVADSATLVVDQVLRFLFVTPPLDTIIAIDDVVRVDALASDSLNFPIANPSVAWTSSDTTIVTVDPSGLVSAKANGAALVTATSEGQSAFATMVVRQDPELVALVQDNVALTGTGDTVRLTVELADRNGYPMNDPDPVRLTWRTLSPIVASVDSSGLVSAFEDGTTGIIVSVSDTAGAPADTALVVVTGAPPQEWIAFWSRKGIEIMAPVGGARTVLYDRTISNRTLLEPAWSPDGASMVVSTRFSDGCALHLLEIADPSRATPLSSPPYEGYYCDVNPAWSPTGAAIAFARVDCPWTCFGRLQTIAPDGTHTRELPIEDIPAVDVYAEPAWSPDGSKIAFAAYEPNWYTSFGIYVVPAVGGVPTLVIDKPAHEPVWSPDGSQLAYVIGSDIWVSGANGTGARNLTSPGVPPASSPAWSPDGTQIVFAAAEGESYDSDLYVINVDGTGLRRLTFGDRAGFPTWRRAVPVPARPGGVVSSAQGGV